MNEQDYICKEDEDPIFTKFLLDTRSINKTIDLSGEWYDKHGGCTGLVNTNNYHEAEFERNVLEWRIKEYGLNREDFQETFDYYDELIENGKREEAENPPDDLTEELMIYDLNSIAMDFSKQDLRYDDPNFFDEIERRRKKQLESFFKFGSDSDLDYGDPMITHELARRFRERLENGEISRKELKRLLGMN